MEITQHSDQVVIQSFVFSLVYYWTGVLTQWTNPDQKV